ncbi:MAG: iron dicitrate transport regulator FecR, partial [Chryseobacterium sp.]
MEMKDDLLISYLLNEASVDQAKEIDNWRAEDAEHELRFKRFQLIWERSKN